MTTALPPSRALALEGRGVASMERIPMNIWLNVLAVLILVGAAFYASLIPYMTRDE